MDSDDPRKAIPYYQRIYVLYGGWTDYVAKAYLKSGIAFEQLEMKDDARNTYVEMLANEDLQRKPEYKQAEERLQALK